MNVADKPVANTNSTPPRAPLAFRIGVVGHRLNRLDNNKLDLLAATMSTILNAVRDETHTIGRRCTEL
jgi:hypothetical protein